MSTVFLRLLIVYFVTVCSMRLMGKRQIGEMQMSELVCAFFLSELASYPVTNQNIPLTYGIIPVITLICTEVILSYLSTKVPFLKHLLDSAPSAIIRKGKLDQKELARARMTLDELLGELRLKDVSTLSDVDYALLESNGKLSVIRRGEGGMEHLIVEDGQKNKRGIQGAGMSEQDICKLLKTHRVKPEEVFLLCVDDEGKSTCIRREDT